MLEFNNLTEAEIDKLGLLAKGRYKGEIVKSESVVSLKGFPQIRLQVRVTDNSGNPTVVPVYLSTNGKFMMRMLRHFCYATGLEANYESKKISSRDCENKKFLCEVDIQEGNEKFDVNGNPNGKWDDKNIIVDFIKVDSTQSSEPFDETIPF